MEGAAQKLLLFSLLQEPHGFSFIERSGSITRPRRALKLACDPYALPPFPASRGIFPLPVPPGVSGRRGRALTGGPSLLPVFRSVPPIMTNEVPAALLRADLRRLPQVALTVSNILRLDGVPLEGVGATSDAILPQFSFFSAFLPSASSKVQHLTAKLSKKGVSAA